MLRLQKYLSEAGVASRRKSEEIIAGGRVSVNGEIIREQGVKVDEKKDHVYVDGKEISLKEDLVYIMLHKPRGYITTVKDQFGRKAVTDLLKGVSARVFPVGRLDYDTTGLLILTNDGELTYKLTHPSKSIPKTYIARVRGKLLPMEIKMFCQGVIIDGRKTAPAQLEVIEELKEYTVIKVIITEGRNRQVKKMCKAIGHPVLQLKRTATGELSLGDLEEGKFRRLTEKEIEYLKKL